jgi:hypothetical protein
MNDEIAQLQEMKKQRQAVVDMRDRLIRLYTNPDFKAVFLKEYMVDEVARFMETAGNPNVPCSPACRCSPASLCSGLPETLAGCPSDDG